MAAATTNGSIPSRERIEPGSVNIPLGDFPATATSESVDASQVAQGIISKLNDALANQYFSAVTDLFLDENSYWRDHLALSWELRTLKGSRKIWEYLQSSKNPVTQIEVDSSAANRAPAFGPIDAWGDVKGIQFYIRFETEIGRGRGMVRLAEENGEWKIFMLATHLEELKGFEESVGKRRTMGVQHGGNPDRKNWKENREANADFEDGEPRVLILGMSLEIRFIG